MKNSVLKLLRGALSLTLVAWLLYYLYENWDAFRASADVSLWHLVSLACCVLASWLVNAVQIQILLRMEHIHVGFWENFSVQTATFLGNLLPMRAGTALRFVYFKRLHDLEYSRMGGLVVLRTLLLVVATGFTGCLGLLALGISDHPAYAALWMVFVPMLVLPLMGWWLPDLGERLPDDRRGRIVRKFVSGFVSIKKQPKVAAQILVLMAVQFALLAMRLLISFDAIQVSILPQLLFLLAPITTLLSFISITPGNLGLREWVIGLLSQVGGYQFETGVFAGVIDRTVQMVCIFAFGAVAMVWMWARLRRKSMENHACRSAQQ